MLRIYFGLILFLCTLAPAHGQELVEWFEPRLKAGSAEYTSLVTLIGKVSPGTSISVNPNSLNVIQYSNKENSSFSPKSAAMPSVANSKGFFYFNVLVPFGLTQLTVEVKLLNGEIKPVLITMRVDKESANLNVKVTRLPKIIKFKESARRIFEFSFGISPFFQTEKTSPEKSVGYTYSSSSMLTPIIDFRTKLNFWKLEFQSGFSDMKIKNSIADKNPDSNTYTYNWVTLGGKYRLKEASNVWLATDINWVKRTVFFINTLGEPKPTLLNAYRFGFGFQYEHKKNNSSIVSEIKYYAPFAIKVDKGEIVYSPLYTFTAASRYIVHRRKETDYGVGLYLESDSYNIQFRSSADLVDSKDQKSQIIYGINFFITYRWDKSVKSQPVMINNPPN